MVNNTNNQSLYRNSNRAHAVVVVVVVVVVVAVAIDTVVQPRTRCCLPEQKPDRMPQEQAITGTPQ